MAYQYLAVCLFDFIVAPILTGVLSVITGTPYVQWKPLTLEISGFYHLSMGVIIGIASYSRGQEKIKKILQGEDVIEESEKITTTSTPTK